MGTGSQRVGEVVYLLVGNKYFGEFQVSSERSIFWFI
jgi:hypothetical protein